MLYKIALAASALLGATGVDAAAAFTSSVPVAFSTCNRLGKKATGNSCNHAREQGAYEKNPPGWGGSTPSKKVYGDWIPADDRPVTLKVEGSGGKRFLSIPVSFISQVATFTNSSSSGSGGHATEAEAKVEAMVKVTINKGYSSERAMVVYPPKVTMLERDQKLTVTADNLACLEELDGEWVTCSDASDVQCECGVSVALAVSETVATTFNFYAYPITESGIATVELFYRLSGFVQTDDNVTGDDRASFSAGIVYNTMSAELLQMPNGEFGLLN